MVRSLVFLLVGHPQRHLDCLVPDSHRPRRGRGPPNGDLESCGISADPRSAVPVDMALLGSHTGSEMTNRKPITRFDECGKLTYPSRVAALFAAVDYEKDCGQKMTAYHCRQHNGFHITHRKKSERRKRAQA